MSSIKESKQRSSLRSVALALFGVLTLVAVNIVAIRKWSSSHSRDTSEIPAARHTDPELHQPGNSTVIAQ